MRGRRSRPTTPSSPSRPAGAYRGIVGEPEFLNPTTPSRPQAVSRRSRAKRLAREEFVRLTADASVPVIGVKEVLFIRVFWRVNKRSPIAIG